MDPRLQLRVQRYGWDKAEPFYEKGWKKSLKPAQDLLLNMAQLIEGESVLDISCGTGIVSFEAANRVGQSGKIVGIDLSEKMVEKASLQASTLGFTNTSFKHMNAEELEFEDNSFDVALNALGLMYFPDPDKGISEMNRVLKPNGRAIAAVWGARKNCGWAEIFPIVDSRVSSEVCPMFFQMGTGEVLANLLQSKGFVNVKTERINTELHYTSPEDAINAVFAGGPVAMAYSRFDDPTKESAHKDYIMSIDEYRQGTEYFIPGEFMVVSGVKVD